MGLQTRFVISLIRAFFSKAYMNNEDIKRQIVEALTSGKLQPTNIIIGDQIQHQHNIGKVEAGGIGVNIVQAGTPNLPRPQKGRYNEVREYIEQRKKQDEVFKQYCLSHTRKELCERLSDEFGWEVDDHTLGVNLGRNK
jgi:hypothetical protein